MPVNLENISEHCRLCQVNKGTITFTDNQEFVEQVYECFKIKINDENMNVFPKTVCPTCKLNVQEFFVLIQKIRSVDKHLHDYFLPKYEDLKVSQLQYDECPTNLSNKASLKERKKSHTKNKPYQCPECTKTYARYVNLQLHKREHPSLYCFKCELTFDDIIARKSHVCDSYTSNIEKDGNSINRVRDKCDINDTDADLNEFKINLSKEVKTEDITKEWLEDEFSIKHRDNSDQKSENSNVFIDNNSVGHSSGPDYKNVNNKKKSRSKGNYTCDTCKQKFSSKTDFQIHQKTHETSFSCTYENCAKVCTSAYTLRTHLMKHEGKMPFLCMTCGKGFTTKNSLTCHEKIHAKVKAYNCKECDIGFSVASNLRAHQKKHHEGVRFYCSQCIRAFITKCSLERHELVHAGIKGFKCDSCPAAFYTNKELLKHQRYHQGIRLYKCDQCFKAFFEKHHLTIHVRVHTGERPYVCKVAGCGKSFAESQKLSRHVKARHPSVQ